ETVEAELVSRIRKTRRRAKQAELHCGSAEHVALRARSLDGVFTDPPYFDNVQYAELSDFCYAWLKLALGDEVPELSLASTRDDGELTGNATLGRDLLHFTSGLSKIFRRWARALKPGAPF